MHKKLSFKLVFLFSVSGTLTSSTIDFSSLLKYPIYQCKLAKNLQSVVNKFLFDDKVVFLCTPCKGLRLVVGYRDGVYTFGIRHFYKQEPHAATLFSLFKKSILSINTFQPWRSNRQEETREIAGVPQIILDEIKKASEIPVPSLEEFADNFAMKETNCSSSEEKIYAYDSLKELIEELKSIPSSSGVCGACEGQAIDFSKTLNNNIENVMCEDNYYYNKMFYNDHYRLKLIKSYNTFLKATDRLVVLFYEEYKMNHCFFESPNGVAKKKFDYLVNQLKQSHEKVLAKIRAKKSLLYAEFQDLKEHKERLVGFIKATCALIDHLNAKFTCLRAKKLLRLHAAYPVADKIASAYSDLGENAKQSVIARNYRGSISTIYFPFFEIDPSYYLDALGTCEKLFLFYCKAKTIQ